MTPAQATLLTTQQIWSDACAYVSQLPTPVERRDGLYLKRDDLYTVGEVCGGKARTCLALAMLGEQRGSDTLVTASSRHSPQLEIVAAVAAHLGMAARCHVPGAKTETLQVTNARRLGAEVNEHWPGYNSVICARARDDARDDTSATLVPFGMEDAAAVGGAMMQCENLPVDYLRRLVVPVGSGMTLAGLLHSRRLVDTEIVGVMVGAIPTARLDRWAPPDWRDHVTLVDSGYEYDETVEAEVDGVRLDPVYEAKCLDYVDDGDCLWLVGCRLLHEVPLP